MQSFIIVLLTAKIGFICHEAVTSLKLLEKGFSKEDLALSVLLDFPLQILFGYYAAKWSNGPRPLKPVSLLKIMEITLSNVILRYLIYISGCMPSMVALHFPRSACLSLLGTQKDKRLDSSTLVLLWDQQF